MRKSQDPNTATNKSYHCSQEGLMMLGDYWILSIIDSLRAGEKRFCQLEKDVTGINPTTLTNRLKRLDREEVIRRRQKTLDKQSVTYALTQKGRAILPIIKEIGKFAHAYLE